MKWPPFLAHALGWILFLSLPVFFVTAQDDRDLLSVIASPATWLFSFTYILIFYLNTYLLIPHLYFRRKFIAYAAVVLVLLAGVFFARPFDRMVNAVSGTMPPLIREIGPPPPPEFDEDGRPPRPRGEHRRPAVDVVSIFLFITIIALGMALQVRQRLRSTEQRILKAEADKANAELSFLKAQINPHFLFNTLNNIYSMAVTSDPNTAGSIMKLSNIMRYVTDDIGADYVPLQSEIGCISDYIDLQRLRMGPMTRLDFSVSGNTDNRTIAPLILMSFIENVFKYGTSNHEMSEVTIRITAEEKGINFFCRNRVFANRQNKERTGIGISNTRQRLQHLYPGRHRLDIGEENGYFTVSLTLEAV